MSKQRLLQLMRKMPGRGLAVWVGGFVVGVGFALYIGHGIGLFAQLSERPGCSIDNPIDMPRDLSGFSIKNPRVRVVHTTDPSLEGGSMYMQQVDPWLGYMWGKSLTQRNFRERDGVYGDHGKIDGLLLADGATKMMDRSHTNSCAACHNNPYRDAGAGMTIAKNGGQGRNTPHLYGGGLVEMIGLQMRLQALAIADTNRDGWISFAEMKGKRCVIRNMPTGIPGESVEIDFGSFDDENGTGYPNLNSIFYPIFVDKNGERIATAKSLKSPEVAGYTFEVQAFGFGHLYLPFRPPVSTTLRSFTITPFDIHSGLQAHDPTTYTNPRKDALALVSNAGAQQFVTAAGKDRGGVRAPTKTGLPGISLDDPDRDGYCEEISEGDLDVAEWYLLNHPAPARGKLTKDAVGGEKVFHKAGCTSCHTPDWHLFGHNPAAQDYTQRFDGDRRFFELHVGYNEAYSRMEGKLVNLSHKVGNRTVPNRKAYTIRGIYSDFKYHDMGPDFYQLQFDGSIIKMWKTAPLWGVGTTAPYAHDGASLDLDSVIRRHGGEGTASKEAYVKLTEKEQRQLIAFLNSLVLYQTDTLPCDINGDGKIDEHFMVAGMNTGIERFNPEWLFKIPAKIEGPVKNVKNEPITSYAIINLRAAYGLDLPYLRDTDGDGF
ncbi:MAG TPA: di-heme oxidoredictase family protein, partial [Gemmataceae bacterium]|nr:di-heme oxidoredictase family protein [Gemmataceae bacterium]